MTRAEEKSTLSDVRNILAGLRCEILDKVEAPDPTPVVVGRALYRSKDGSRRYVVSVEIPPGSAPPAGKTCFPMDAT